MSILWAFIGIVLFAFGGFISTDNWKNLSKEKFKIHSRYSFFLFIGLIFLVAGGFLSTFYWNKYFHQQEFESRRETMIKVLAAEFLINKSTYEDSTYREPNDEKLKKFVVFPKFRTNVLQEAISSGLFILENDKVLFTEITHIHSMLLTLNDMINLTQFQIMYNSSPDSIKSVRMRIRDGATMSSVKLNLEIYRKLLLSTGVVNDSTSFYLENQKDIH